MSADTKPASITRQVVEFVLLLAVVCVVRVFILGFYQVPTGSMETTMLVGERFLADKLTYFFRPPQRGEIVALVDPTYKFSNNWIMENIERYVWGPTNWTKRVVGLPGDLVQGKIEDGRAVVYINGKKLDEPYLNKYPLIAIQANNRECVSRSFDPSKPYNEQPFYRIDEKKVIKDNEGKPCLIYPNHYVKSDSNPLTRGNRFKDSSDEFSFQLGNDEFWLMGDNRGGSSDSRKYGPIKQKNIFGRMMYCILSVDSYESWLIWDIIKNPIAFVKNIRWGRFIKRLH
jgi:signal peptidase I